MCIPWCRLVPVVLLALLAGCATLQPAFDKPTVTVEAFRALPADAGNPRFAIDLHVVNPNSRPLKLKGIAYTASVEGHQLLAGASNQLPVIEPYGSADVSLTASANMLSSFRLLMDIMSRRRDGLDYTLNLKMEVSDYLPVIKLTEKGTIGFGQRQGQ